MLLATVTVAILATPAHAAELTSPAAKRWRPPAGFIRQAMCIHRHESTRWHRNHVDWRGLPSRYTGGYQFTDRTWAAMFRPSERGLFVYRHPAAASVREQTYRAFVNWRANGRRWGGSQWPNSSRECGLA